MMSSSRYYVTWAVVLLVLCARHVELQDHHVILPGDVTLAAMFMVQDLEQGMCGKYDIETLQSIVGVTWFLQALNRMDYIPGVTLGLDVYRTCKMADRATEGAVKLLNRYGLTADSSTELTSNGSLLFGLLGPERTSEALVVSSFFSSLPADQRLLQVSGSATGKQLSDGASYPNFFRVMPPDETQIRVILELLLQMQWNYVAIVYDDDDYGRSAATELRQLAEERQVCVPVFASLPIDTRLEAFSKMATKIGNELKSAENGIVRGMVILGGASTTRSLLEALGQIVNYVTLVLSEAVGLQGSILLTSSTGQVSDLARGAMVTTPPYLDIPEFTAFWNQMWTNRSAFENHAKLNPWIGEYFYQVIGCFHNSSGCWDGTESDRINQMAGEARELSLFCGYQVKATAVMAVLLKHLHTPCSSSAGGGGGGGGVCSELRETLSNRQGVLDTLRRTPLDLSAFSAVSSVFSSMPAVSFSGSTGDIVYGGSEEVYTVYNFRQDDDGGDFKFRQIGSWVQGNLTIITSQAQFYDGSQDPLTWSQLPPAQCDADHDCVKCERDVSQDVIFMEGDFYLVGILPVSDKNADDVLTCGPIKPLVGADIAQSLVFAVQDVNRKSGLFENVLPGRRVGLIVLNSCGSHMVVKKRLIDLHSGALLLPGNRSSSSLQGRIMGYIGAYYSGNSVAAAEILGDLLRTFVQVSGASTSPMLSDINRFPYFVRLPAPDDKQTLALLDIIQTLGANYIQVVYDGSTTYGSGLFVALRDMIQNSNRYNICIAQSIETSPKADSSEYVWIKNKLREKPEARIVVVILHHIEINKTMDAILPHLNQEEFMFIATESWGRRQILITGTNRIKLAGSMVLSQEIVINPFFQKYFLSLQPDTATSSNPWLASFWEARLGCYFRHSFRRKGKSSPCSLEFAQDYLQDFRVPFHIHAVSALVIGFQAALTKVCGLNAQSVCQQMTSADLFAEMLKVKLDLYGTGQPSEVFDSKGDGLVGYKVLQIEPDLSTSSNEDVKYADVGSWNQNILTLDEANLLLASKPTFRSNCTGRDECNRCFSPPESGCPAKSECKTCFPSGGKADSPDDDNQVSLALFAGVVVALILIIAALVVFFLVTRHRQKTALKAAFRQRSTQLHNIQFQNYSADRSPQDSTYFTIDATTNEPVYPPPTPCRTTGPSSDYIHAIPSKTDLDGDDPNQQV